MPRLMCGGSASETFFVWWLLVFCATRATPQIGKGQLEMATAITQADPLNEIKLLYLALASSRQEYDFQPPALVSHANQYATQPERLRRYAKQVINGRIMMFFGVQ